MAELFKVERPAGINRLQESTLEDPKVWQNALNTRFQHGLTKKVGGFAEDLGEARVRPEIIVPLRDGTGDFYWWAYVGLPEGSTDPADYQFWQITDSQEHRNVTPDTFEFPTTGRDYKWTGDTINGVPYLTYGIPYYFENGKFHPFTNIPRDGTELAPNSGDPRVRFQTIRTYRNFMIGMDFDTDDYPGYYDTNEDVVPAQYWGNWTEGVHQNAIWWSDIMIGKAIDQTSWEDANSIKSSGWNFLGGAGGNIIDGKTLRDSFIIYRERSVWQMSYIGGVQVFAFKEVFNDVGCLGLDCVIEIDGEHLVVGQSDVYRHNGVRKASIADGKVRAELFDRIHPSFTENVFIAANYKYKEAWICIPTNDQDQYIAEEGLDPTIYSGACNFAYVYNWQEDTWAKRTIPWLTSSIYTILSISDDQDFWDAYSEGGLLGGEYDTVDNQPFEAPKFLQSELDSEVEGIPSATPYFMGDPEWGNNDNGEDEGGEARYRRDGVSWGVTVGSWADTAFKYNPSEWGLAATSKELKIFTFKDELLFNGDEYSGYAEKTGISMGESLITKHVSRVYPLVRYGTVDVQLGHSRTLEGGILWESIGTFDPETMEHMACRVSGRFLAIRFTIPNGSNAEIRGYLLEYDFIGRR